MGPTKEDREHGQRHRAGLHPAARDPWQTGAAREAWAALEHERRRPSSAGRPTDASGHEAELEPGEEDEQKADTIDIAVADAS